jgi:7,8-dihydro-6-hydroxymethylpterin-pyrophosphokinase
LGNFEKALKMLQKEGLEILDVSGLYESEPMYVEEQPQFLNAVCKV